MPQTSFVVNQSHRVIHPAFARICQRVTQPQTRVHSPFRLLPILLVVIFVCGAFSGCRSADEVASKPLTVIPEPIEIAQGKAAYQDIISQSTLSRNQAATEMLERVGKRIAAVAGRDDYEWEFKLIESRQANAFALPGGKVAFYEGILPLCENEAGVAVVMSHEIAHALQRHGGERMTQELISKGLEELLMQSTQDQDEIDRQKMLAAYGAVSKLGVALPFSRSQEAEADRVGLLLMARAGYDPSEAPRFWQRFAAAEQNQQKTPEFFSTHPSSDKRAAELTALLPAAQEIYSVAPQKFGTGTTMLALGVSAESTGMQPVGRELPSDVPSFANHQHHDHGYHGHDAHERASHDHALHDQHAHHHHAARGGAANPFAEFEVGNSGALVQNVSHSNMVPVNHTDSSPAAFPDDGLPTTDSQSKEGFADFAPPPGSSAGKNAHHGEPVFGTETDQPSGRNPGPMPSRPVIQEAPKDAFFPGVQERHPDISRSSGSADGQPFAKPTEAEYSGPPVWQDDFPSTEKAVPVSKPASSVETDAKPWPAKTGFDSFPEPDNPGNPYRKAEAPPRPTIDDDFPTIPDNRSGKNYFDSHPHEPYTPRGQSPSTENEEKRLILPVRYQRHPETRTSMNSSVECESGRCTVRPGDEKPNAISRLRHALRSREDGR